MQRVSPQRWRLSGCGGQGEQPNFPSVQTLQWTFYPMGTESREALRLAAQSMGSFSGGCEKQKHMKSLQKVQSCFSPTLLLFMRRDKNLGRLNKNSMIKHFLYCLLAHFHLFQWAIFPAGQKGEVSASFIFLTMYEAKERKIRYVPAHS